MLEITNIDKTEDLRKNPKRKKPRKSESSLQLEGSTVVAKSVVIINAQGFPFSPFILIGEEGIFISLEGDVVDVSILDCYNREI